MERARRAGKPLIISRLPTRAASGNQPNGAFIQARTPQLVLLPADATCQPPSKQPLPRAHRLLP